MDPLKLVAECSKAAAPVTAPVVRAARFNLHRWKAATRALLICASAWGFQMTSDQLASTLLAVEAILLALSDFTTPNIKLTDETVAAARAGLPAPGVSVEALKEPFKGA